jgi:deazaflavin-dependent oxidoreductase (nitroreductase family)
MRKVFAILSALATLAVAAVLVVIIGVRTGNRPFIAWMVRLQRDVLNPGALRSAGTAGDRYAVVEHVGRKSGSAYETPVGLIRDDSEWFIALPYGPQTSWAVNIAAAGEAVIRVDGARHRVHSVRIVPIAATPLPQQQPIAIRIFGIRWAVRMTPTRPISSSTDE